jgi:hypothetical protein
MIDGQSHGFGWVKLCILMVATLAAHAQQPIAFPHNKHIQMMGMECVDCHSGADTHAEAGIPSVTKCMLCHAKLGRDKAEVKKVIDYANQKIEIPWQRVYEFALSAHVKFKHAQHYQAGVKCATCHGDMTQATVAAKAVNHNMGTCLACHRQNHGPEDCAACHY